MKKLLFIPIFFSVITFTACNPTDNLQYETFRSKATVTISNVGFEAEITESSVKFTSENLSEPIYFENNIAEIEDFSVEIAPQENSAFYINELIIEVLSARKNSGYYKNTEYSCEFDKTTKAPRTISWGDVLIEFNFFEQGSLQ